MKLDYVIRVAMREEMDSKEPTSLLGFGGIFNVVEQSGISISEIRSTKPFCS